MWKTVQYHKEMHCTALHNALSAWDILPEQEIARDDDFSRRLYIYCCRLQNYDYYELATGAIFGLLFVQWNTFGQKNTQFKSPFVVCLRPMTVI